MGNEGKNGRKFVDRNPLVDARFSLSRGSQDSSTLFLQALSVAHRTRASILAFRSKRL